jgi:hypothetical protein
MALRIDQTLTQDATGTLVMLEFEAMGLPRLGPSSRHNTWITICFRPMPRTPRIICSCTALAKSTAFGIADRATG